MNKNKKADPMNSGSQTFLHVDPQLKYTVFWRPHGLTQQILIPG